MINYIFGPVASRRFGLSLGIDLSPFKKSCNFDCLYCELPKEQKSDSIYNPPKVKDIIEQLKVAVKSHNNIDVITITANGEPTLYEDLSLLIDEIKIIFPTMKILILSNGSNIHKQTVQNSLKKIDIVKLSLDCATDICFKKLDRPIENNLQRIIDSMIDFRKEYKGFLVIEILVVKNVNDDYNEFLKLKDVLDLIKPDRIDVGTVERPPAYKISGVSSEKLEELSKILSGHSVNVVSRSNKIKRSYYSKDEIIATVTKRPLSKDEIFLLFDEKSLENLDLLLKDKILEEIISNNKNFVKLSK